ncbi:unnamed protein product, partial [Vitis vinifera]|uniref:Uncharacterized protein n=1 Tax=Vitis vinifera TaxID=29760 RepID=D7TNV6_VITVI
MNRAELAQIVEMSILCDSILFDECQWYQAWMTLTFLGQVTIRLKYLHTAITDDNCSVAASGCGSGICGFNSYCIF